MTVAAQGHRDHPPINGASIRNQGDSDLFKTAGMPPRAPTLLPAVASGPVIRRTRVDGLINEYSRLAA